MNKEEIRQIAEKVLLGTATEEEREILHRWYDGKTFVEGEEIKISDTSPKGRMYRNIVKQIPLKVENYRESPHLSFSKWIWSAAAILVLVLSYTAYYFTAPNKTTEWISVNVSLGKMERVILPDSSVVWLNAGTQFRYPTQFRANERQVELIEGQAFFDVKKSKEWPFRVSADELRVTVVGTSFEVKSFFDEKNAVVGVQTGQVNISYRNNNEITSLHPGEIASVDKSSSVINQWTGDPQSIGSWKENRLEFSGELLGVVVNALERKYNVEISAENPELLNLPVTIKLDHQPLEDILEVLGYSLGFNYKKSQNEKNIKIFKE